MIKEPGLTALRISYAAIRTPLELVNEQVVARAFGADSTAHRSLTHGLQTVDALAAKAFARCADEPVDVDADAPERADQTIDQDEQREISDLADRYLENEQLENRAGELADDDEVRRVQAEIRAKQEIEDEHGQF